MQDLIKALKTICIVVFDIQFNGGQLPFIKIENLFREDKHSRF